MVFVQWASLPVDRQHATNRALYDGSVRLVVSQESIDEVREVLNRAELRARLPQLTPERVGQTITETLQLAEWFSYVPRIFTWAHHPDDAHIFNLAIAARAEYLVTWETRIHKLAVDMSDDAIRLRNLAPQLGIITPKRFAEKQSKGSALTLLKPR
jgi:predicted nucleic acid-binding protein